MTINAVKTLDVERDKLAMTVHATTWLPATPTLLIFCCGYKLLNKKMKRGNQEVPHGNVLYLDCVPQQYSPDEGLGTEFHWTVNNSEFPAHCNDCHYAIVELGDRPRVDWTTQVYPCPPSYRGIRFTATADGDLTATPGLGIAASATLSVWVNGPDAGTTNLVFLGRDTDSSNVQIELLSTSAVAVTVASDFDPICGPGTFFQAYTPTPTQNLFDGQWHHVLLSFNSETQTAAITVDRVSQQVDTFEFGQVPDPVGPNTCKPVEHPGPGHFGGADSRLHMVGADYEAQRAELWLCLGVELDVSDPAIIDLFCTEDGEPEYLGPNGELPTGAVPDLYGSGGPTEFLQPNLGSGGDFSPIGVIEEATLPIGLGP